MRINFFFSVLFFILVLNDYSFCSSDRNIPEEEKEHIFELGKGYVPKNIIPYNNNYSFYGRVHSYFYPKDNRENTLVIKGSGVMISPSCVLTCASNLCMSNETTKDLFQYNPIATKVIFKPMASLYEKGFYSSAEQRKMCREWGERRDPDYDLALIKLKEPLGLKTGYITLKSSNLQDFLKKTIKIKGYVRKKVDYPWIGSGIVQEVFENKIYYDVETNVGASGSCISIGDENNPVCIGIHTNRFNNASQIQLNSGVGITEDKFNRIKRWLTDFGEIKDLPLTLPIRDIARATAAAPNFFSPSYSLLLDGRTYSNSVLDNLPHETLVNVFTFLGYKEGLRFREINGIFKRFIGDYSSIIWPQLKIIDGSWEEKFIVSASPLQVLLIKNIVLPSEKIQEINALIQSSSKLTRLHLRAMQLSETEIMDFGPELRRHPNITFLDLAYNNLGDDGIKALSLFIKFTKNLANINLSHNGIQYQGIQSLAESFKDKDIISLNLAYNSLKDSGLGSILDVVKRKKSFEKLNLTHCDLTYHASDTIARFLEENQAIRSLILSDNNFGHDIIQRIAAALRKNTTLTELDLKNNKIGSASTDLSYTLQNLWENTTLHTLSLAYNELKNEDAESLARLLRKNKGLVNLDLSHNLISDEGAEFFALGLKYNTTLTKLDLSYNYITSNGKKEFTRIFNKKCNSTLSSLQLDGNPLEKIDSTHSWYNFGLMYETKREFDKAKELYIKAAEEKYPPAQHKLGEIFHQQYFEKEKGKRDEEHWKKSVKYYKQAAEAGYVPSQVDLGNMYVLEKDYESAKYWYKEAEKKGSDAARTNLQNIKQLQ